MNGISKPAQHRHGDFKGIEEQLGGLLSECEMNGLGSMERTSLGQIKEGTMLFEE